ncbi:hypothetical protein GCM10007320_35000 [Pseudorhodoferax aquiterrae]|uniref:Uncharacterized protein n=1 Tax=Pseudorhodoferax aquiterrae TaxID=747304 RepID=A0ABQ3G3V9_9BURK|nr:hypothetical protein [Pseudorhodoferax aquiterrae]GHC88126.1 hypothetical protein GCM10007320_35000 [Pseudorhodoferax aquiterrae]
MAEDVISRRSAAQRNSVAFQYMREQVAREMDMLYALLQRDPPKRSERTQPEARRSRKKVRAQP